MGLKSLRFFNGLFSLFMAAILIVTMLYAGFALWDNHQIYHTAETVFDEMKEIKARMAAQVQADEAAAELARDESVGVETVMAEAPSASAEVLEATISEGTVESFMETGLSEDAPAAAAPQQNKAEIAAETIAVTDSTGGQIVVQAQGVTGTVEVANAEKETRVTSYQPYGAPFDELKAINPDVNGWLTMPETAIDYPLLQGETNYAYINTDVYGNFALSGSIFLDSRNNNEYLDVYSLLYGHNMSKHRMFGDVNLYKDQEFFEKNQQGELYLPDQKHTLQTVSCIVCSASDWVRFNPESWRELTNEEILQYAQEDAMFVSETGLTALQTVLDAGEKPRLVALSTCSSEFTDARTILLTIMDPVT